MNITLDTEIRHLPSVHRRNFADIMDINDGWLRLANLLPRSSTDDAPLYNNDQLARFPLLRQSPTISLLDDWGTRGRVRPTIRKLIDYLAEAQLLRAAHYLYSEVLRMESPFTVAIQQLENTQNMPVPILPEFQVPIPTAVPHILYQNLYTATRGFNKMCKLGQGGFGTVYLGETEINGKRQSVAIKKLNVGEDEQFQTELRTMSRYQHECLLQILGFSCDNPESKCLVTAYMVNGSLEEQLANKKFPTPLTWSQRVNIAIDTASGLVALHTMFDPPLVHRDIKSANILLDSNMKAKIGDFGIARLGGSWEATTKAITHRWCGTPVYMAAEVVRGSVTVKADTYSFGVVLFELLTGLPPYDSYRSEPSLVEFINDEEEKLPLEWKDSKTEDWPDVLFEELFKLAKRCVDDDRRIRPLMENVLKELSSLREV